MSKDSATVYGSDCKENKFFKLSFKPYKPFFKKIGTGSDSGFLDFL
jgi:hypothetical protein